MSNVPSMPSLSSKQAPSGKEYADKIQADTISKVLNMDANFKTNNSLFSQSTTAD